MSIFALENVDKRQAKNFFSSGLLHMHMNPFPVLF